jgi:hypothetical protein
MNFILIVFVYVLLTVVSVNSCGLIAPGECSRLGCEHLVCRASCVLGSGGVCPRKRNVNKHNAYGLWFMISNCICSICYFCFCFIFLFLFFAIHHFSYCEFGINIDPNSWSIQTILYKSTKPIIIMRNARKISAEQSDLLSLNFVFS